MSGAKVKAIRQILIDAEVELGVGGFWKGKKDKRFNEEVTQKDIENAVQMTCCHDLI